MGLCLIELYIIICIGGLNVTGKTKRPIPAKQESRRFDMISYFYLDKLRLMLFEIGQILKACAKLFRAVGADVTISARKLSALAEAEGAGYKAELITALADNISGYTIIINTVPAMILDEKLLGVMDKNSLIIDLASRPGGVDHETAAKLNRRVVWALGLPAKAAPMTAGEIIARTVTDILNERGTKNVT